MKSARHSIGDASGLMDVRALRRSPGRMALLQRVAARLAGLAPRRSRCSRGFVRTPGGSARPTRQEPNAQFLPFSHHPHRAFFLSAAPLSGQDPQGAGGGTTVLRSAEAQVFVEAFRTISRFHVSGLADSVLWERTIDGLIDRLDDPYATVFTPTEFDQFREETTGNYAGIGVQIGRLNARVTVTAVFRGTPPTARECWWATGSSGWRAKTPRTGRSTRRGTRSADPPDRSSGSAWPGTASWIRYPWISCATASMCRPWRRPGSTGTWPTSPSTGSRAGSPSNWTRRWPTTATPGRS